MISYRFALVLIFLYTFGLAKAGDVIVPDDSTPFSIKSEDIVRLTGKGIAGSRITIDLNKSPVKVESEKTVVFLKNGAVPKGETIKEFEIKAKEKGMAKIIIIVKPPQPDLPPEKIVYEFEIK